MSNVEDYHGRRAHWAAKHGGTTLATFLPENGAKVDAKDRSLGRHRIGNGSG
ncbi:hypothetical protein BKA56DRAFT_592334 [Ilyonectria sp. MPI-CAGE-AT-0026]|nr:hypothetical protein BKA56DRAFT_592334 [Ilyonectria sp. MPI-CAGE-AT-0026]